MKCVLCNRAVAKGVYCKQHMKAYENVVSSYVKWKNAMNLCWKEYLSEVAVNPLTGRWAKEVALHLIKTGEQTDVKIS
jgi:hypothetical protein